MSHTVKIHAIMTHWSIGNLQLIIKVKQRKKKTVNTNAYMIYIATLTYFSKESPTNFFIEDKTEKCKWNPTIQLTKNGL